MLLKWHLLNSSSSSTSSSTNTHTQTQLIPVNIRAFQFANNNFDSRQVIHLSDLIRQIGLHFPTLTVTVVTYDKWLWWWRAFVSAAVIVVVLFSVNYEIILKWSAWCQHREVANCVHGFRLVMAELNGQIFGKPNRFVKWTKSIDSWIKMHVTQHRCKQTTLDKFYTRDGLNLIFPISKNHHWHLAMQTGIIKLTRSDGQSLDWSTQPWH